MRAVFPSQGLFGPMSLRYGGGIALEMLKFTLIVLLGAEAVFLSDVVISDLLPAVLDHQASVLSLLALIVFTMPGVMIIALPLAILVGSYIVIMNRRQAAEFAVIAGMGISSRALISLMAFIGLGALAFSHMISGYAEPLARYQLSKTLFQVEYDALREARIAQGEFYQIGDYAVFIAGGQISGTARNLFVHERVDQETYRVIMADQSVRLRDPQIAGIGLMLHGVTAYEVATEANLALSSGSEQACIDCTEETDDVQDLRVMASSQLFVQLREADLPTLTPRGTRTSQWTNLELLRRDWDDRETVATFAERLLRDLLCFCAPLIGLLAAAMTTSRTYLLALPIAGAAVLCAQFLGSFGVKSLAGLGLPATVASLTLLAFGVALVIAIAVVRCERGFISPLGGRV